MHSTVIAVAENTLQALNRLVSMLRGKNFRVLSVTGGRTEDPAISHVTIVVDSNTAGRVVACLKKLDEVRDAEAFHANDILCRELAFIRVKRNDQSEPAIDSLVASHEARIIDHTDDEFLLEVVGDPQRVDWTIQMLNARWISAIVRVGPIAVTRGTWKGSQPIVASPAAS